MEIITEKIIDAVVNRRFDLRVEGQVVPGLHWLPEGVAPTATMHINPGPHAGIPTFERDASLAFVVRHFLPVLFRPRRDAVKITDDKVQDGVRARRFELAAERETVPGMVWTPEGAEGPRPKVLFGHGGSQHKEAPIIVTMARALVIDHGFAGGGDRRRQTR